VARVIAILRALAEAEEETSLTAIAQQVGLARSTTHRLLNLLMSEGLVERGRWHASYRIGVEYMRLASLVVKKRDWQQIAEPFLKGLAETVNETSFLSVYLPAQRKIMLTQVHHGKNPLRFQIDQNVPIPIMWGAAGRAVLAFLPDETIAAILQEGEPSPATGAPMKRTVLKAELESIRKQGYALTQGQLLAGAVGIGAPVFGPGGHVVGALCIRFPESRHNQASVNEIAKKLVRQAHRLNAALGNDETRDSGA